MMGEGHGGRILGMAMNSARISWVTGEYGEQDPGFESGSDSGFHGGIDDLGKDDGDTAEADAAFGRGSDVEEGEWIYSGADSDSDWRVNDPTDEEVRRTLS